MTEKLWELGDLAEQVMEAIPTPLLVVDDDVRIIAFNRAASPLMGEKPEMALKTRAGEVLHCFHSTDSPEGCGRGEECGSCVVRGSVNESLLGKAVVRKRTQMDLVMGDSVNRVYVLVTTAPFSFRDEPLVILTIEDISDVIELKSMLPICASCKKVRDDTQYWHGVEEYFKGKIDVDFTHCICPECARKLYPDLFDDRER